MCVCIVRRQWSVGTSSDPSSVDQVSSEFPFPRNPVGSLGRNSFFRVCSQNPETCVVIPGFVPTNNKSPKSSSSRKSETAHHLVATNLSDTRFDRRRPCASFDETLAEQHFRLQFVGRGALVAIFGNGLDHGLRQRRIGAIVPGRIILRLGDPGDLDRPVYHV